MDLFACIFQYSDEYGIPIRNCFNRVKQRKTTPNPQAIDEKEFNDLLRILTPENGIQELHTGSKPRINYYRPYLKDAFKLGMYTGRRRQELIAMKFNNIINDVDGFSYIKVEDFKVNHIQDRQLEEEKKHVLIPITKELLELLQEIGLEKYQGKDKYILAPEITNKRTKSLSDDITRGFSHFYNLLGTGKKLTFRSMRKSYITSLSLFMGGNAKAITGHCGDAVIEKFYLNKKMLVKAATNFQVFNKESERMQSMNEMRNEGKEREINIEK